MGEIAWCSRPAGNDSVAPAGLICPTRGRPGNAARLIDRWGHAGICSDLIFCLDDDDPQMGGYQAVMRERRFHRGMVLWLRGPRQSLCGWTNQVAGGYAQLYQGLMSVGDDHAPDVDDPGTMGFDLKLLDACGDGGFAYGDDGITHPPGPEWPERHNLPTAWMVTTNIVRALGWMCLPGLTHMFCDAAVRDLAEAAGCRHFLPGVKVTHLHHITRQTARDQTYIDGEASWAADEAIYRAWRQQGLQADAEIVREAIS
jgi:hypothetical protein